MQYRELYMVVCMVYVSAVMLVLAIQSAAIDIKGFQPAIIPLHSVIKMVISTADNINTSSSIQCRFNDISMPAQLRNNLVFCDTPPMRKTDKAVLHLEVDGKLHKAKTTLRFHEPFKVTGITPKMAFPSQQLHINISGITCQYWMTFFVKFQTANGTTQLRKGICVNSIVTCYVPEFPARSLLRVGVTLSNTIVKWSPIKLLVQYPVDAKNSLIEGLSSNIQRKGAFTFKVLPRDKFKNILSIDEVSYFGGFSVQYSPNNQTDSFRFPTCSVTIDNGLEGSKLSASCSGVKHEKIQVYPLINNVVVGERRFYEVKTTLCPGKSSCSEKSKDDLIATVVSCIAIAVVITIIIAIVHKYRWNIYKSITTSKLERKPKSVDEEQFQEIQMKPIINLTDEQIQQEDAFLNDNGITLLASEETVPEDADNPTKSLCTNDLGAINQNSSSKDPVSRRSRNIVEALAFDNTLRQNIDNELETFTCDGSGVGVVTDGVVAFAQRKHSIESLDDATCKKTFDDIIEENGNDCVGRINDTANETDKVLEENHNKFTYSNYFEDSLDVERDLRPFDSTSELASEQNLDHHTRNFVHPPTVEHIEDSFAVRITESAQYVDPDYTKIDACTAGVSKRTSNAYEELMEEEGCPEEELEVPIRQKLILELKREHLAETEDPHLVYEGRMETEFSYSNDITDSSEEEDVEVSIKDRLLMELKNRLKKKYRRSKIDEDK